jgi:hypothetical protein
MAGGSELDWHEETLNNLRSRFEMRSNQTQCRQASLAALPIKLGQAIRREPIE